MRTRRRFRAVLDVGVEGFADIDAAPGSFGTVGGLASIVIVGGLEATSVGAFVEPAGLWAFSIFPSALVAGVGELAWAPTTTARVVASGGASAAGGTASGVDEMGSAVVALVAVVAVVAVSVGASAYPRTAPNNIRAAPIDVIRKRP